MSTFERCPPKVTEMAESLFEEFDSYKPLLEAKVRVDFVFALADLDPDGQPAGYAILSQGHRALGQARILRLKDRVMGRADAEILLDKDWWNDAPADQQRALLDHELHHLVPKLDKDGAQIHDDIGRPKLALRKHDFQFGWFTEIARRQGPASIERTQAARIAEEAGQFYWPSICSATNQPELQTA